jgi:uncharacterized protein (TIGR03790 family)
MPFSNRRNSCRLLGAIVLLGVPAARLAADPASTAVAVNRNSLTSRRIAAYYVEKRLIPAANVCVLETLDAETIARAQYATEIERPIAACVAKARTAIRYIVLTQGIPLRIRGSIGQQGDNASVDSELAALRIPHTATGPLPNPMAARSSRENVAATPVLLVARLAGYSWEHVKRMIDDAVTASRVAQPNGRIVIDLASSDTERQGEDWLHNAALQFPATRVSYDASPRVLEGEANVIAWASWGSNDKARKTRTAGFKWLPGSIVTEYVSTDARTFVSPPPDWKIGTWADRRGRFAGSPQSMIADYLAEGATAATGHVDEPYLTATPRPDILLPDYLLRHRTLGEAFYRSICCLSWQSVLVGDPLTRLP